LVAAGRLATGAFRPPDFFAATDREEVFFRAGFAGRAADAGAAGAGRWK
jgi:hypothetical protein